MSNENGKLFEELGKSIIILGFISIIVGTFLGIILHDIIPYTGFSGSSSMAFTDGIVIAIIFWIAGSAIIWRGGRRGVGLN